MFYIPHLAWQTVSFSRLGTDLNQLVAKASEALVAKSESKRDECIQQVARALELLLFAHRDYRRGVLADFRRSLSRIVGFLFASKRLGTWTVFAYFCIKLTYLSNTVIQLYIMMIFLNYDHNMFLFAWKLVGNLLSETYWTESLYFPRLSYCTLRLRHLGARENVYAGVCALPVNMFNEKIYIFLFFWVMIVMLCTAISLLVWVFRMSTRRRRCTIIKKYLRLKQLPAPDQIRAFEHKSDNTRSSRKSLERAFRKSVDGFVNRFLCFDGVFLIHVMTSNVGDVITADLVALLWKAWITRYAGRPEWEQPSDVSDNEFEYVSPTVDEGRTLTESTMSGQRTNTGNSMEIRRRPHEAESARTRPSLPQSPATWTC
ncbi:Innexin [Fasciola hepatica]|uniref:Innexin n=1 Tax=Fasciola hepatica TaxID=6192 RepID=A0A2H1CX87_FASHE|nr:Innexin [Fasciola hepatica]